MQVLQTSFGCTTLWVRQLSATRAVLAATLVFLQPSHSDVAYEVSSLRDICAQDGLLKCCARSTAAHCGL